MIGGTHRGAGDDSGEISLHRGTGVIDGGCAKPEKSNPNPAVESPPPVAGGRLDM